MSGLSHRGKHSWIKVSGFDPPLQSYGKPLGTEARPPENTGDEDKKQSSVRVLH